MKLDISVTDGWTRLEYRSFDAYNEATKLQEMIENFHKREGHYPSRVLADKIYRNRENLSYCKERGIRLSGPALGRPKKGEKHYRNQYIHGSLDRMAAMDLLEWGLSGERTPEIPNCEQQHMLRAIAQILQLSGITIELNQTPIEVEGRYNRKNVIVYPAMWAKPSISNTILVSDLYLKYAKPYALKTIIDSL